MLTRPSVLRPRKPSARTRRSRTSFANVTTLLLLAFWGALPTSRAFVTPPLPSAAATASIPARRETLSVRGRTWRDHPSRTSLRAVPHPTTPMPPSPSLSQLSVVVATAGGDDVASWRQYVPLAVSLLVITDILLGSPFANAAASVLRSPSTDDQDDDDDDGTTTGRGRKKKPGTKDLRERVDTMAIAQQALDRASSTTELRRFLDESKSDMDKMRDVQKRLDEQLQAFDAKQKSNREENPK